MNYCRFRNDFIKRMANAGGATPILPPEYQQVEYLQSTGTQYINTNVVTANNTKTEVIAEKDTTGYGTLGNGICGVRGEVSGFYSVTLVNGTVYFGLNSHYNTGVTVNTGVAYKYTTVYNNNLGTLYLNDTNISNHTFSGFTNIRYIYLFALNSSQTNAASNYFKGMVYRCTISQNSNGTKIIDLIPCYRKSDNKPGMYDLVTNAFFTNVGEGEFTVGQDV